MPSKKVNEKQRLTKKVQQSEEDEVLDDEDESEYDEENGSEDDDFIVDDEQAQEEYIQAQERQRREQKKLQKKQEKENQRKRISSTSQSKLVAKKNRLEEDDEMDDDDYQLILDNQRRKKKLTKIVADESEEDQNVHQKAVEKRRNRHDLEEDQQRESSNYKILQSKRDDMFKKVKNEKVKENRKQPDFLEEDEERISSFKQQEKKDKFINEDLDDLFATQQDYEIMINDIPERLALKLKGRLDPSQEELDQEAVWLFKNIIGKHTDINLGVQESKDMHFKISEALKQFKNKKNDIPYITKYKQKNLLPELKPQDVWRLFNLDIEYSKFNQQIQQVISFFQNISELESSRKEEIKNFINQLSYINNVRDLKNFQALVDFYKQYFQKELELQAQCSQNKKLPVQKPMFIFNARQKKLDEFSRRCTLAPQDFVKNIEEDKLLYLPNQPQNLLIKELALEYATPDQKDFVDIIQEMCDYTVLELQSQPDIRRFFKNFVKENGFLETEQTEKGKKELDIFHPSYRVKKVKKWLKELENDDFFLDVEQNVALGLITFKIDVQQKEKHLAKLFEKYQNPVESQCQQIEKNYIKIRKEIQQNFCKDEPQNLSGKVYKSFSQSIIEEVEVELREDAENFILNQCRKKYQNLIESSYYKILNEDKIMGLQSSTDKRLGDEEMIPQRERLVVMGAVFHPIDNKNYSATIAVLDKYGELVAHKNFLFLIPPRKQKGKDGEIIKRPGEEEEIAKYQDQKRQLQDLLRKHSVDLIVVCADCLEARRLKKSLVEIAQSKPNHFDEENDYQEDDRYNVVENQNQNLYQKEPIVIWGRPEVPKLFADSNYSQKLHKNHPKELKKAISVARFEQDPMLEVLNLWSPIMNENQALNLNLHPLQKHINKARLMDILEEVNVQTVNNVGVDLNIMLHHKHMHNQLQFVSGLGPRKAAYLISKLKHIKEPIYNRMEIYERHILSKRCHTSSIGFIKIRVPPENKKTILNQAIDYLDQTRIHPSNYEEMEGIACFCLHPEIDPQQLDEIKKKEAINELFRHPEKLKLMVDSGQINNRIGDKEFSYQQAYDQIIFDFLTPFRDPREDKALSSRDNPRFDIKELFYCLINESERTFKKGITVQATVVRIQQPSDSHNGRILCRLENGLEANVNKDGADFFSQVQEKSVITGRIDEIKFGSSKDDENFSVTLKCRQQHLRSHEMFIENSQDFPKEDLINYNFQQAEDQSNILKKNSITYRKINHPKFANINSMIAVMNLNKEDNGEFYFRPSSKGTDHLTLTWKFFDNNIVHIDIIEENKPIGANIGPILKISDEKYENLQEIVERYITICNRSLQEVIQHPKFMKTTKFEEIKEALEKEKSEDENRIPYRFTVLSDFPQFIVLGYMPKQTVVREFIKVKPRGFHFHNQYFFPFQELINWFKCNFRTREYQNILKKSSSPQKVGQKPINISQPAIGMQIGQDRYMVSDSFKAPYGKYQYQNQLSYFKDSKPRSYGRGQRDSQQENQHGDYQRDNDTRTSSFQRNRDDKQFFRERGSGGGNKSCFKCNEEGHFAKDCPNPGSGMGRGAGGKSCHNCGESGHFVKDCTQPRASKGRARPEYQNRGGSPYKRQRNDNDSYSNREEAASGWCRNEIQGQPEGQWGANQNNY